MDRRFPKVYTNYTDAVLDSGDDVLNEWEVFAGIAARNGTPIDLPGGRLPVDQELTDHDLLAFDDHRPMVLRRALVQAAVLRELVLVLVDADRRAVDVLDRAGFIGVERHVGVARDDLLHARADHRNFGAQDCG